MRSASFALFPLAFHPGHRHTLIFPNRQFPRRDTTYVKINVFFPASPQLVQVPTLKLGAGQTHFILTFTYPLTVEVVWSPQMTTQPVSSIFLRSPLPSGTRRTLGLSIAWCCLPTSSSVCDVFFSLSLCLTRWFWPDLFKWRHVHTTAVCVSLRSSGDFHVVLLPAGSWHRLPRW